MILCALINLQICNKEDLNELSCLIEFIKLFEETR